MVRQQSPQKEEDVAVEITNDVYGSVNTYFNTLRQLGYKDYGSVYKLLAYTFIEELLTGPMRIYVTEDDYRAISKALNCLYGSNCLIPYPQYVNDDTLFGQWDMFSTPRITEVDSILRAPEKGDNIRFKSLGYNK